MLQKVKLEKITGTQPQRDNGNIEELKQSIQEVGLINPLTLNKDYKLLAGRRRFQVISELGWKKVECKIFESANKLFDFKVSLEENLRRKPLTDLEVASAIKEYDELKRKLEGSKVTKLKGKDRFGGHTVASEAGWTQGQTAKDLNISRQAVTKAIQIAVAVEKDPKLANLRSGSKILSAVKEKTVKEKPPIELPTIGDGSILAPFIIRQKEDLEPVHCPHFMNFKWANGCHYDCQWCYIKGANRGDTIFELKEKTKILMHLGEFFKQDCPSVLVNAGEVADGLGAEIEDDSIAAWLLGIFGAMKRHRILFLTKGTLVRHLINTPSEWHKWAVLAWSLNAPTVAARWEPGAPVLDLRLKAAKEAYDAGFEVRFKIGPIMPVENWKEHYKELVENIFRETPKPRVITLETLRVEDPRTRTFSKDKSWVDFLSEKTDWGWKIAPEKRIEIYNFMYEQIRDRAEVGLCKETHSLRDSLSFKPGRCNCAW